jgi:hypothetical protein
MSEGTYVCKLSPELQERARVELNEDPKRRAGDIEAIRVWMKKQPHINGRTDDAFILMYLRNCKFSLERTKEKIDKFYTVKTALPDWFKNRDLDDPTHMEALQMGMFLPLKGYDNEGRRVIFLRMGVWDPSKVSMDALFRMNSVLGDMLLQDEQAQICGVVGVEDLAGMTLAQAAAMTPPIMKKATMIWQDCLPMRMKGMHYINMPSFFETIFNMFKAFMKDKLKKRLHVHGNIEGMYKFVPREILPEEYGGQGGKIADIVDQTKNEALSMKQYIMDQDNYFVDESKRPGKPKTMEDLFGMDGSFRKLNVD